MGPSNYNKRTDRNHSEIRQALKAIGVGVQDTSGAGHGIPDLICAHRGQLYFVEVKDGLKSASRRKLTVEQVRFQDMLNQHGCKLHIATSKEEALAIFGARVSA